MDVDTDTNTDTGTDQSASPDRQQVSGLAREPDRHAAQHQSGAPIFKNPPRAIGAVEVPAIVQNLERAEKAFGRLSLDWKQILDPKNDGIPFYLNPESPFRRPIMSHNASTHNVLLKVAVPKRTGRKRKRGSDGPFEGEVEITDASSSSRHEEVCSHSRLDHPKTLRRKLQDTVDSYKVEAVGLIRHTHRFRGFADFSWDMESSPFVSRFMEQVMSGDVSKMKNFEFVPGIDQGPNVDIIPPPLFTHMTLPFNYFYTQNPYVRNEYDEENETVRVTNTQMPSYISNYMGAEEYPIPTAPQQAPNMDDADVASTVREMHKAFEERPIWTRRSLVNRVGTKVISWNVVKRCIGYVGYQFKGGPGRDAIVKYGMDPRSDPKYRIYQTLMFKLHWHQLGKTGGDWKTIRREQIQTKDFVEQHASSHIFDGQSYYTDGKVWQVCDLTDPLLANLFANAAIRPECDLAASGWYHQGLWAKAKGIMKHKLTAIQFGRRFTDEDYRAALSMGDRTPTGNRFGFMIPLPPLKLTQEELQVLHGKKYKPGKKSGFKVQANLRRQSAMGTTEATMSGQATPARSVEVEMMNVVGEDSDEGEGDGDESEYGRPGGEEQIQEDGSDWGDPEGEVDAAGDDQ